MKNMLKNKNARTDLVTYLVVIVAFVIMQVMNSADLLGSSIKGFLIPICAYISLAVSQPMNDRIAQLRIVCIDSAIGSIHQHDAVTVCDHTADAAVIRIHMG